jgi:hypothetical protein
MKNNTLYSILAGLAIVFSGVAAGQPATEKIPIPLTDPNRPAFLKIGLISGGITVKGYAGKEVIVEATVAHDDEDAEQEKPQGTLKLIPNTSIGLSAEEDDNTVSVSTGFRGGSQRVDLRIQVPSACSMKLSTINGGDIVVENVNGDLEVNNTNGSITLKHIAGSAVAQTVNGEVHVDFTTVNAAKAMSFISLNGDVDVTFPASLKATVQMKSEQGEIYSDFDVQMQKTEARIDKNEKGKGKYRVTLEKAMRGTINGGGQEIQFSNFNGSIYIRKGS